MKTDQCCMLLNVFLCGIFYDCHRSSVCCYSGNKHPCHPGIIKKNSKCLTEMTSQSLDKQRIKTEAAIARTVVGITSVFFICMVPSRIAHV